MKRYIIFRDINQPSKGEPGETCLKENCVKMNKQIKNKFSNKLKFPELDIILLLLCFVRMIVSPMLVFLYTPLEKVSSYLGVQENNKFKTLTVSV